ncbi:glycoside hydrolase family 3 N-terminal domain-containing protein [Fulvivirgaceae bacterium BMA12]|uniref:beta-glucosidase n=1 Tax=Agaribacillus aureus TaxID=3051825 RepID=A0ABT8L2A5_9BACT|nr:glycoside hydrolase family 3 N-terminal domain-containing protein [Fulvivirgaceae bacterium BMA12]
MKQLMWVALVVTMIAGCENRSEKILTDASYGFIDSLISVMTLDEKIGQMTLYTSGWDTTGPTLNDQYKVELKAGRVGALFNAHTVAYNRELQRIAVEETNLGIPLLFGYDVIHGHKTIFPIPLAESCTWDLDLIRETARLSAKEATASGLNWTFNPMVDVARDPRWGRVAEGAGEDPYLVSLIGAARVRGYQGDDLKDPYTMLACVKHFAAYGAAQAGRDYHTVDMSDRVLREIYLPPYKAAIDAGATTVMTSFNEIDGVPVSGNKYLLTEILRDEWKFDGFVVTDYTSINEMVPHGIVADEKEAASLALKAGVDMDMQGGVFNAHLGTLIASSEIKEEEIDKAVRKVLMLKERLGLFDNPYLYLDEQREKEVLFSSELMDHALEVAKESIVLLKNEHFKGQPVLPVSKDVRNIAVIGPLGDNQLDLLGTWHASGDVSKVVTLLEGIRKVVPGAKVTYAKGVGFYDHDAGNIQEARKVAASADVVILALGENYLQSGEAASRASIDLPGQQNELVKAIMGLNKPTVAVVMAGRPLTIQQLDEQVPAILNGWHLGTMAGQAIAEVLFGVHNPSGKLTMTYPRSVGQIPICYSMKNTGRPFAANNKYTSKYLDESNEPLYPFGYGLSYTSFEYGDLIVNKTAITTGETLNIKVTVKNTGSRQGSEVVQLYTRDLVGSVTRPVKELKGFEKITLAPDESKTVEFSLSTDDLAFYTRDMSYKAEPGEFKVYVGGNSAEVLTAPFSLVE